MTDLAILNTDDEKADANDPKEEKEDKIVPMRECPLTHTYDDNLGMPEEVNSLSQFFLFSPYGIDTDNSEAGMQFLCNLTENVHRYEHTKLPMQVQLNLADCGGRLAESIADHKTEIDGQYHLPRRLLCFIMGNCNFDGCEKRLVCGYFFEAIRDFLEKTAKEKEKICKLCIKHFKESPNHIHKRLDEPF